MFGRGGRGGRGDRDRDRPMGRGGARGGGEYIARDKTKGRTMATAMKLSVPKPVNLPSIKKEHAGNDPNAQLVPPSQPGGWNESNDNQNQSEKSISEESIIAGARWASNTETNGAPSSHSFLASNNRSAAEPVNRREYPALGVGANSVDNEADADLYARRHDPISKRFDDDERRGDDKRFDRHRGTTTSRNGTQTRFYGDSQDYREKRDADGWGRERGTWGGDRRDHRGRNYEDEEDPFAEAEARELAFSSNARGGGHDSGNAAPNTPQRDNSLPESFQAARNEGDANVLESRQNSVDSGRVDSRFAGPGGFAGNNASRPVTGPGGGGGGFYEPDRYSQASNYGNGRHDNDRNGRLGGSHARADARSGYKNDDFSGSRGTTPLRGGSGFGFDARRDTLHGQNNMDGGHDVSRDFAHMSLGRGAPPLPPGAPPGGRQRPPPPPMEDERDEARDAFQLELERVMAEQEAERQRREIVDAGKGDNCQKGAPGAPGAGPGNNAVPIGEHSAAGWQRNARELAGSALVSHPPPPPGPPPGAQRSRFHIEEYDDFGDEDGGEGDQQQKERKKRGGRRVREAEERRAAKEAVGGVPIGGLVGSVGGGAVGNARVGMLRPIEPAAATGNAGGWGAGALGGLAWAGPIADIQHSASSDALIARARLVADPSNQPAGAGPLADAAASMAAAAHHHQAAAANNAFAYESAIAALDALVDRGGGQVAPIATNHSANHGFAPPSVLVHGASVGLGFGGRLWSGGGGVPPPLPPGPRPQAMVHGMQGTGGAGYNVSSQGMPGVDVASRALEDE